MRAEEREGWEQPCHAGHCHWFPNSRRLRDILAVSHDREWVFKMVFFWVLSALITPFPSWVLGKASRNQQWMEEFKSLLHFYTLEWILVKKVFKNILRKTSSLDTSEKDSCVSLWLKTCCCGLAGGQTSCLKVCVCIVPVYGTESTIVVSVFLQT